MTGTPAKPYRFFRSQTVAPTIRGRSCRSRTPGSPIKLYRLAGPAGGATIT